MKTIEVIIAPDGSSRVETDGFSGSDCRQASEFLEHALGSRKSERLKADFFRTEVTENQQARQQH